MPYACDIKICGLTTLADARLAFDAGADYLGFVLYAGSPRALAPDAFRRLRDRRPTRNPGEKTRS